MNHQCWKCRVAFDPKGRTQCPLCDVPLERPAAKTPPPMQVAVPPPPATPSTRTLTEAGKAKAEEVVAAAKKKAVKAEVAGAPKALPLAEAKPKAALLVEALTMARMGCGGTEATLRERVPSLGDKKLPKPPGWMSDKWRGDSMPKSEMSAWCTHSRKKCGEAGFEIEDQKADGPKLIGLIEGFLAGLGFDPGGAPKQ